MLESEVNELLLQTFPSISVHKRDGYYINIYASTTQYSAVTAHL